MTAPTLRMSRRNHPHRRRRVMGRILLGVIIGVLLVIWLLVSCVGVLF
jgi:uncharacterized membrane protein